MAHTEGTDGTTSRMEPMMTWTIRRAAAADAGRLSEVARRAKAHWGYPPSWLARWDAALTIAPAYVEAHPVFAAEDEGVIVAFCALEDHGDHWVLEHVWVAPERHGRGIGQALVRHALRHAHAIRPGTVAVTSDPGAAQFYARLGARRTGSVAAPMEGAPDRELPLFQLPTGME